MKLTEGLLCSNDSDDSGSYGNSHYSIPMNRSPLSTSQVTSVTSKRKSGTDPKDRKVLTSSNMDDWYDWDASDAPEWSLYREWFDEDEMDERFWGSGGFTEEQSDPNFQFLVDDIIELSLRLIVRTVVPPILIIYVHLAQFTVSNYPSGIMP